MKHSRLTLVMLYLFFVPLALDVASTYGVYMSQGHLNTEANPIYVLTSSRLVLLASVIIISVILYFFITKWSLNHKFVRWLLLSIIMWYLPLRTFAVWGNISTIYNPVPYSVTVTNPVYATASKISYYYIVVGLLLILPLFIQVVTYLIYKLDYDITRKLPEPPKAPTEEI
jgi:hypothetical protein